MFNRLIAHAKSKIGSKLKLETLPRKERRWTLPPKCEMLKGSTALHMLYRNWIQYLEAKPCAWRIEKSSLVLPFMCSWFHVGFCRPRPPCLETGLGPKDRQYQHSNWLPWDPSIWLQLHTPRLTTPTHRSSPAYTCLNNVALWLDPIGSVQFTRTLMFLSCDYFFFEVNASYVI